MRTPPADLAAERAVLGAALVSPHTWRTHVSSLEASDFFSPQHAAIHAAMLEADRRGTPIDLVTLADGLRSRGMLENVGGEESLIELAQACLTTENTEHYVKALRSKADLRKLIGICGDIADQAFSADNASELIEKATTELTSLATRQTDDLILLGSLGPQLLEVLDARIKARLEGRSRGVRFGVQALDSLISGIQEAEQCVLAGDVGSGKTALALQAALTNVVYDKGTSLVFTLEMTNVSLLERVVAHMGKINSHLVRCADVNLEERQKFNAISGRLNQMPLYTSGETHSLSGIVARARRWRARHPDKQALLVVDFLQIVDLEQARGESYAKAVGRAAYRLKRLAKELKVAVIVLSQLNREGQKSKTDVTGAPIRKPPSMHDLKESGDIEASADQVVLIWNPEQTEDGDVEIHLAKMRSGMTRKVTAHWTGRHYLFS